MTRSARRAGVWVLAPRGPADVPDARLVPAPRTAENVEARLREFPVTAAVGLSPSAPGLRAARRAGPGRPVRCLSWSCPCWPNSCWPGLRWSWPGSCWSWPTPRPAGKRSRVRRHDRGGLRRRSRVVAVPAYRPRLAERGVLAVRIRRVPEKSYPAPPSGVPAAASSASGFRKSAAVPVRDCPLGQPRWRFRALFHPVLLGKVSFEVIPEWRVRPRSGFVTVLRVDTH